MKKLVLMVRTGPVVVGEFRGGKGETAKRFDKTDKNAPPLEFGMYKMNLEMLADGSPVMVTAFVKRVTDPAQAVSYLCKYLSKPRARCLRRARLWSGFGKIERTRVRDVLVDTPKVRLLRRIMGKPSVQDELNGIESAVIETKRWRPERNFRRALQKAEIAYLLSFDPEYLERQEIWQKVRFAGLVDLSHSWSSGNPLAAEES